MDQNPFGVQPRPPGPSIGKSIGKPALAVATKSDGPRRRRATITVLILSLLLGGGLYFMGRSENGLRPGEDTNGTATGEALRFPPSTPAARADQRAPTAAEADESPGGRAQQAPDAELLAGATFRDPLASGGGGPVMVVLSGGAFQMGSSSVSIVAEERPQREVTVKPFAISKHEITIAEYLRFAKATGRKRPPGLSRDKNLYPVHSISWEDAHAYTRWLSDETGQTYRLPSEAQWEYAALGGTDTPYWWGFEVGQNQAHCQKCETGLDTEQPTQVGRFAANPFGLHDTAGNVAEWVHDCFHDSYEGAPTDGSVWEGGDCTYRIVRGGSFHSAPPGIRSRARNKRRPNDTYDTVGIRVVRDLRTPPQAQAQGAPDAPLATELAATSEPQAHPHPEQSQLPPVPDGLQPTPAPGTAVP